jgi:hypothetical protein
MFCNLRVCGDGVPGDEGTKDDGDQQTANSPPGEKANCSAHANLSKGRNLCRGSRRKTIPVTRGNGLYFMAQDDTKPPSPKGATSRGSVLYVWLSKATFEIGGRTVQPKVGYTNRGIGIVGSGSMPSRNSFSFLIKGWKVVVSRESSLVG